MADSRLLSPGSNGSNADRPETSKNDAPTKASRVVTSPASSSVSSSSGPFNVKSFVAIISFLGVFLTTEQMLRFSVLTTLERRFSFTTAHNGVIVSAYDMGHVVLLIILSVYGSKIHRPRMCALGGFLSALSGLLWAAPHLIYGSGLAGTSAVIAVNQTSTGSDLGVVFCQVNPGSMINGSAAAAVDSCSDVATGNGTSVGGESTAAATETIVAFVFLFLSQCFLGAGLAPFLTVAITYLDDNTDPATSALGVSVFLSVASIGLVFGFLLGAAMTGVFVDLAPTHIVPTDPEWIGAWWLGSVIISAITIFVSAPLLFFPRSLNPEVKVKSRSRHSSLNSSGSTSKAEKMRPMLQRRVASMKDITDIKEASGKTKSLVTNCVYLCTTFAMCAITFLPGALFPFLPKYLETQFGLEPMTANIITSIVTALAVATGTFTGGYIASAMELTPLGSAKLVLIGLFIGTVAFSISIFLGCPTPVIHGMPDTGSLSSALGACMNNCSCAASSFLPVCGGDQNYFSACHAGCSNVTADLASFSNCSCLAGGAVSGVASAGLCDSGCSTMIPYAILIFITTFTVCMGTSPIVAILIRSVAPEQKSIALGVNNVLTSVLAAIPGPMIYGKMIDSACSFTETSCEGQMTCILYDNNKFRLLLHGVTEVFILLAGLCIVIAYISLHRSNKTPSDPDKDESKTAAEIEGEAEPMMQNGQRV